MEERINEVEIALREIYDNWMLGIAKENDNQHSAMFRMGFPDEFIHSCKPLLMFVGQECREAAPYKDQIWVRKYQNVQLHKQTIDGFNEQIQSFPFWNFYRRLAGLGFNVIWNNLDKFHPANEPRLKKDEAVSINEPYLQGGENLSILQREIALLKPDVILLAIGKEKYTYSLASAFGIEVSKLFEFEPTIENPIHEISNVLNLNDCKVFWTYHPQFLQRKKKYFEVLSAIEQSIL